MDRVWTVIEEHRATLGASGELAEKRRAQQQAWLWSMIATASSSTSSGAPTWSGCCPRSSRPWRGRS